MKKMLNIGYSNYVNMDKVVAIVDIDSASSRRLIKGAKELNNMIEATHGKKALSVIATDYGQVITSAIDRKTLIKRIEGE